MSSKGSDIECIEKYLRKKLKRQGQTQDIPKDRLQNLQEYHNQLLRTLKPEKENQI